MFIPFAVKTTGLFMQVGLALAETTTLTGCTGLTVMDIALERTTVTGVQGELEVIRQVTISPLEGT
jgi:hypothetical protein